MDKTAMSTTKVITNKCRLSYSHVWDPSSIDGVSEAKYGACIVIPKSDIVTIKKIKVAVEAATQEGIKSKWKGKKPAALKLPLRDGDEERPDDETFAGCYFINANSKNRPGVIDLAKHEILDTSEVYSGCYCRFSINFYPFSTSGSNGVAVGLNNIQKVADGAPLAGHSRAEDDFDDDYEGEDFSELD
ncbi:MAG: DUF2815 family protein [Oscillospiraceae bacterium]